MHEHLGARSRDSPDAALQLEEQVVNLLRGHLRPNNDMEVDVWNLPATGLEVVERLNPHARTEQLRHSPDDVRFEALVHDDVETFSDDAHARVQHEQRDGDGDNCVDHG